MEQLLWADVWIFRVNFFRDYMKKHPGFVLADGSIYDMQIYDCVYDVPGENLDGWYCEKCKGLVIYVDIIRNREQVLHRLLEE
ncbi:MAG: hypothetical protein IJ106_06300 [Parasporobacterium sp.]|nr:hypothetical protein [Parasporobacterium sp.]